MLYRISPIFFASLLFAGGLFAYQAPPYPYYNVQPGYYNSPYSGSYYNPYPMGTYGSYEVPNRTSKDRATSMEIENRIRDDYYLAPYADYVQIYTLDGVVTLTGRIDSDTARLNIENKARGASGVRQINNNIEVVHSSW